MTLVSDWFVSSCAPRKPPATSILFRAIGPSQCLNFVPLNPCSNWLLLVSCRLGIHLFTLMQHCQQILLCQVSLVLALNDLTNTIIYQPSFPPQVLPVSRRVPSQRLYRLTVDTNFSILGQFGMSAPMSKAYPLLCCSCSCSVGLFLVDSAAFLLRTGRL